MVAVIPKRFFWIIFFIIHHGIHADASTIVVDLLHTPLPFALHDLPSSFFVCRTCISADVVIDEKEVCALADVHENVFLTPLDIQNMLQELKKKNKYQKATLTLTPCQTGFDLTMDLEAFWTLKRVLIKGVLVGRDRYRQYYQFDSGERFDSNKHQQSLASIVSALTAEGYRDAYIADSFSYDEKTKSIVVTLTLHPGERFVIDDAVVTVTPPHFIDKQEALLIGARIKKVLDQELSNTYYTRSSVDDAARSLRRFLLSKGYLDVGIEMQEYQDANNARVRCEWLVILRQKKMIDFIGNAYFSSAHLIEQILLFGKSAAVVPPSLMAEEIAEMYKKKGFWDVAVTTREEDEHCYFVINEGKRAKIAGIFFEGVTAFDPRYLVKTYFNYFVKPAFFDADMLKQGLDEVVQRYVKDGFWYATIDRYEPVKTSQSGEYTLKIVMKEGSCQKITGMSTDRFKDIFSCSPYASFLSLKKPEPFNVYMVQEQRQWLLKELQRNGYLYASPRPTLIESPEGMHLSWHIEGCEEPVRFGKTVIIGSSQLPSHIITRELSYDQGDVWDPQAITRSLSRLRSLGIFESITLSPANILHPESTKTMIIRCVEDDPFEVRVRGGVAINSKNFTLREGATYAVGGSLVWKNPTNHADRLLFDADVNRFRRDLSLRYIYPWFLGVPLKAEGKGYSNRYDQPLIIGSVDQLYKIAQDGFLLNLSHSRLRVQCGVDSGFEWMRLYGLSPRVARAIHFDPFLIDRHIPYWFIEPTVFLDYLDDKVNPRNGFFSVFSIKSMVPLIPLEGRRTFFAKVLAEHSAFYPLADRVVIAARLRLGHIFHERFDTIMPNERFFLGGPQTIRGYEPDYAPPLGAFKDSKGVCHLAPIGGRTMVNGNLEVRIDVWHAISMVLFTDMGVLARQAVGVLAPENILGATGFGLRYNTPIGPVRFDIGWKWKKSFPSDRSYAWSLTLGQAF